MENQPNSYKKPLLLIAIFIVLLGGGFGIWSVLKKDDKNELLDSNNTQEPPPLTGRNDVSSTTPLLSPELLAALKANNDSSFGSPSPPSSNTANTDPKVPPPPPIYIGSPEAKQLITAKAERLQSNSAVMDIIRAKYDIGKSLIDFGANAQKSIDSMFGRVAGVDLTSNPNKRYLTFPIYGTHEQRGAQAKGKLLNLLSKDPKGYTLANTRHKDSPWWIDTIQVNLLVGTDTANTRTADQIWWGQNTADDLNWFRDMNGIWKNNKELVDGKTNGVAWYWAGNMLTFVRRWVEAIEYLDLVTEWEAIRTLSAPKDKGGDGWNFTYMSPKGVSVKGNYDPQNNSTNDNTDSLIIV